MMAKYGYVFQFLCDEILRASDILLLQIWKSPKRKLEIYSGTKSRVRDLNFSPNGHWIATCSPHGTRKIRIWRLRDGFSRVLDTSSYPWSVRFSMDGRYISIGGYFRAMVYIECAHRKTGGELERPFRSVTSLEFTPDGKGLLSASWDKKLSIGMLLRSGHLKWPIHRLPG
jgi:WD40 repeat protein